MRCVALQERVLRYRYESVDERVRHLAVKQLPGSRADSPMDEVAQDKEKEQNKDPSEIPRNHGDVVVGGVNRVPATAAGYTGVTVRATYLIDHLCKGSLHSFEALVQ